MNAIGGAMRRIVVLGIFAVLGALPVISPGEELGFGFGGSFAGILLWDLSSLNSALAAAGYPTFSGAPTVFGGGGLGGLTNGVAPGGFGFGGETSALAAERQAMLEVGFGGFALERTWAMGQQGLVGAGLVIGGGGMTLTVRNRYPQDFSDALENPGTSVLELGFFGILPYLGLRFALAEWLWVEGRAGYLLGLPGQWKEGGRELTGPEVPIRTVFLSLGLAFGGTSPIDEELP